jgi:hypothetical protein
MQESPLSYVDEHLTEEYYKNIIQHSKNPEDQKMKESIDRYSRTKGSQNGVKVSEPFSGSKLLTSHFS